MVCVFIIDLLTKYSWESLSQPAHGPDLIPRDYDLNPRLKESMRGVCFRNIEVLMARLTQEIHRVNREGVLDGIHKLLMHWEKCVALQGDYIERF